jgi:hypothetical protein
MVLLVFRSYLRSWQNLHLSSSMLSANLWLGLLGFHLVVWLPWILSWLLLGRQVFCSLQVCCVMLSCLLTLYWSFEFHFICSTLLLPQILLMQPGQQRLQMMICLVLWLVLIILNFRHIQPRYAYFCFLAELFWPTLLSMKEGFSNLARKKKL